RHLMTIPCTIVAAPSVIQRYGTPTHIQQFEELPCITTVSALKGAPWQFVNSKGEFETIKVKGHYRVNSGEMAGRAAVAGVGFAILSKQACQPYINDGLDVAIIITRGQLDDSDYVARHLMTIPCTIVAAPSVIQRYGTPTHIQQFEELP
ncbi:LysR substrate-binding domain-containing protein, partial [Cronobacter sakazakii]|uniref:LysR substrate-binding domain-containing protein n=1 Tax=Cronobacter sakazakii TaxID=28141 RepID=UPI001F39A4A8